MGPNSREGEDATFAVLTGQVPIVKQRMPLSAPSIALGSAAGGAAAGRDSDSDASQQVSDSRSGMEDEWERAEGQLGGAT